MSIYCDAAIKDELGVAVGYSDHTLGTEAVVAAVALGPVHREAFYLDKNMAGPDHQASADPEELRDMVVSIRNMKKPGLGVKR